VTDEKEKNISPKLKEKQHLLDLSSIILVDFHVFIA